MTDNEIMTALRRCADRACYRCTEYGTMLTLEVEDFAELKKKYTEV